MSAQGHDVEYWTSPHFAGRLAVPHAGGRKWLGYVDQFIAYPSMLARRVRREPRSTLFVVTDHALGPWVPRIARRPHVIHCHDFLAQRSAVGELPENPTSWTGQRYQALIRRGYRRGQNFISVSHRTRDDLHRFLGRQPLASEVVHNGLNGDFRVLAVEDAQRCLRKHLTAEDASGFLLHVGGNQWYKNRCGVVELYRAWCKMVSRPVPLWLVGAKPAAALIEASKQIPNGGRVRFLTGLTNEEVIAAYNMASLFLFPSLEEGFGWPIAEAMACGTQVITTNAPPMTEVGGDAAIYHRRSSMDEREQWARDGAELIAKCLNQTSDQKQRGIESSLINAKRFDTGRALGQYEAIYREVLATSRVA
ncbi:D-inositol-3-phosphate glycosyltransferase [Stieleria neptunia]|uniref:D-inositol-3-phosphate glycosyltransferase n=2 Tax=Stieleria neptunia TaxID=2527979 RepID=A0A518HKH2_9BACT|nr:D-inositol-3-phosphate glycosyltransferase [Stieleria neptunia]